MNNGDINKKISELGITPETLNRIGKLFDSEKSKKIADGITGEDKQKLIKTFLNMNTDEIKRKLNNADLSQMSKLSSEDILKKLR